MTIRHEPHLSQDVKNPQPAIWILDFGSQYTQLIARRLREIGVYCEIFPHTKLLSATDTLPLGVILSGGPDSVGLHQTPRAPDWIFSPTMPVLGICYGMQTLAVQLGGEVVIGKHGEFGHATLSLCAKTPLFADIDATTDVWMSHGDTVMTLPPSWQVIGKTDQTAIAAMGHETHPWFGLQFHPEVTHTPQGMAILKTFVVDICKAPCDWTPQHIVDKAIVQIKDTVGQEKVLLGLSGGVDSSVLAVLLHRAIGDNLIGVFVDTGLLRAGEATDVMAMFEQHFGIHVIKVDAATQFFNALSGITCPEEKRKTMGKTFIDVFEATAKNLSDIKWLAQGTIYPDVIESAAVGEGSVVIKSHHNVGGLPETLPFKLLEPLRTLFKDEVRQVGLSLGLPPAVIYRHPFPGPGLAVRVLGEVREDYVKTLRLADAIFIEALRAANLYDTVSQAFAVFLPVKSVGVVGDGRRYDFVVCLRAVQTSDFMTAHWSPLSWDFLRQVSTRIMNEVPGISRVTYDISDKPPATIEWE